MSKTHILFGLILGAAWPACQAADTAETRAARADAQNPDDEDDDGGDANETALTPAQIPQAIQNAARAAVPGLVIEAAELEDGGAIYCVHGRVNGRFTEVEVSADGKSTHVEGKDDEDDDGGEDDGPDGAR